MKEEYCFDKIKNNEHDINVMELRGKHICLTRSDRHLLIQNRKVERKDDDKTKTLSFSANKKQ